MFPVTEYALVAASSIDWQLYARSVFQYSLVVPALFISCYKYLFSSGTGFDSRSSIATNQGDVFAEPAQKRLTMGG